MSARRAPGPWHRCRLEGTRSRYFVRDAAGYHVADFAHYHTHSDVDANMALGIAAPDMLEALKKAEAFIVNGVALGFIRLPDPGTPDPAHQTLPAIRAAIAKATGAA